MSLGVARARGSSCTITSYSLLFRVKVLDLAAAEQRLQRGGDVAHRHAEVLGAVAVEAHGELRLVDPEVGVHVDQARDLPGPRRAACPCPSTSVSKSGCRTTNCTGCPKPPNAGGLLAKANTPGIAEELRLHLVDDVLRRPVALATSPSRLVKMIPRLTPSPMFTTLK